MKVVLLAGGMGTRLSEETGVRPKPMVEIGGRPILWHIMKGYAHRGFDDFIVLLGHQGQVIRDYFLDYAGQGDLRVDSTTNATIIHPSRSEPWKITLLDTGETTMTGGRLKRAQPYLGSESFMLTYGDGVSDVDLNKLLAFHRRQGKIMTLTAVQPEARFGRLELDADGLVRSFAEKPKGQEGWISGGYFVCEPSIFARIAGDDTVLEREPMEGLARDGEMAAFRHSGFWKCMDTLRDKTELAELWETGKAPWKRW